VRLGPKSVAVVDDELDQLINELIAERDVQSPPPTPPTTTRR